MGSAVLFGLFAGAARADVLDPLHGYDFTLGPTVNIDNNFISPIQAGDGFGFAATPGTHLSQTGDLIIAILIPTNETGSTSYTAGGTFPNVSASASRGVWSTGDLETFLGLPNGSPNNPIGAFQGTNFGGGDSQDPSASAFNVFTLDLGIDTLHGFDQSIMNDSIGGILPNGALITAFLVQGTVGNQNTIDSANSGVLMITPHLDPTPLPAAVWLFGTGLAGLIGFGRRKSKRSETQAA
jgi:hypothetical protein